MKETTTTTTTTTVRKLVKVPKVAPRLVRRTRTITIKKAGARTPPTILVKRSTPTTIVVKRLNK